MPQPMQDNKWYRINVPIPADLTLAEAEALIASLAQGLAAAEGMMARTHADYVKRDPQDANPVDATATMQPLYFCHNKGL